jgi:hypothetical protein
MDKELSYLAMILTVACSNSMYACRCYYFLLFVGGSSFPPTLCLVMMSEARMEGGRRRLRCSDLSQLPAQKKLQVALACILLHNP